MSSDELFAQAVHPLSRAVASTIIGAFRKPVREDDRFFYDYMVGGNIRLDPATRTGDTLTMGIGRSSTTNTLSTDLIGRGASGDIYKSTFYEVAYKKLVITKTLDGSLNEHEARDLFIETFIPCLLSVCNISGRDFGQSICKTLAVYRDGPTTDDLNKKGENETAIALRKQAYIDFETSRGRTPGYVDESVIMYIKMEYTPQNIYDFFTNFFSQERTRGEIIKTVLVFIRDIAFMLWGLDTCYQFRHRDLHLGNITLSATGKKKIIDFGRSSLVHNKKIYARNYIEGVNLLPCYDLLTLLVCLNYGFRRNPVVRELIENGILMNYKTGISLYTICVNKGEVPWHNTYPDVINTWSGEEKEILKDTLTVSELEGRKVPEPEQLEIIKRIDGILAGRIAPAGQAIFSTKIPPPPSSPLRRSRGLCPSWCTWLTCGCLRGGTRKRTSKKNNKKGKTKRKQ